MTVPVFLIEMIGTIAFAISGATVAIKKDFDVFGILTMGIITAVGGGLTRDVVLGIAPPVMFVNPIYTVIAAFTALLVCTKWIRQMLRRKNIETVVMIIMDSVGLAVFTINGIIYSAQMYPNNQFLLVFTGVITGVGGGVLRDVLAGETPYIFKKHIYACAAIVGAILFVLAEPFIQVTAATFISMVVILTIRILSAYFRLKLPHIKV